MRLTAVGFGFAAFLATGVVLAAPEGGAAGSKGNAGGKGGLGPDSSAVSGGIGTGEQGATTDTSLRPYGQKSTQDPDKIPGKSVEEKPWEVSATWETHRLLYTQYIANPADLTFNVLFAAIRYNLTDYDALTLSGGATQNFIADVGEPGIRATDLTLSYSHIFPLPEKFNLRTSASVTAPISYYSQLASNITTPSIGLGLSRRFGDLLLSASLSGRYSWDRYTSQNTVGASTSGSESGSGQPNSKWGAGGALSAEYSMPFHRPWSIGVVATDSYVWFYDVGSAPASTQFYGATNYGNQVGQYFQSYGGEIFTRYILPDVAGIKSDLTLAFANGDPSLGYPQVLHDGVVRPYLFYYNSSEFYFAFEGRY